MKISLQSAFAQLPPSVGQTCSAAESAATLLKLDFQAKSRMARYLPTAISKLGAGNRNIGAGIFQKGFSLKIP